MGKANSQTNPKSTNNKFWQFRNLADDDQKANCCFMAIFPSAAGGRTQRPRNGLRTTLPPWAM